MVVVTAEI